jgi:hypothetical protein
LGDFLSPEMPKAKEKTAGRSRPSQPSDGSDDEIAPTQGSAIVSQQVASTQGEQSLSHLPVREREEIINNIVRFLLIADQKKLPIKRADIIKHTMKDHSRAFVPLMNAACEKLRVIFGIDAKFDDRTKGYILVNMIDNMYDNPHQTWSLEDNAQIGLVMVILTFIFMKGNKVEDEVLYDMLRRLGIDTESKDETFGEVRRVITTTFVRQGYLDVEKEQGDPPRLVFRWGPRARLETDKQQALDFVCQIYGHATPERWTSQLRDIQQSEGTAGSST